MAVAELEDQETTPATSAERAEAEKLKEQQDIREALRRTTPAGKATPPQPITGDKLWFGSYVVLLIALAILYYLFDRHWFNFSVPDVPFIGTLDVPWIQKAIIGAMSIVLVLVVSKGVELYFVSRIRNAATRYDFRRILYLLTGLLIVLIALSLLSSQWYTVLAPLGLASLVLGLALQNPISSFFGWVYILWRRPYRVGDRIIIGDAKGDVIEVSYFDTTLWEFGGPYLSTEHPSGRIIKFPNSNVFNNAVFNYSWPLFPYVWDEIKFQIAYDSDLEFVGRTMQEITEAEIGRFMMERVRVYRELLAQTPVDELTIQERPTIHFRVSENTWLEAIVRYLVHPKEKGRIKTRLIKKLLARLNAEPDRALFPKSNMR